MLRKVLFVLPNLEEGGIKRIVFNLADEISKYFEVYIVTFTTKKNQKNETGFQSNLNLIVEKSIVPLGKKLSNTLPLVNFLRLKTVVKNISPDVIVGVPIYSILSVVLAVKKIKNRQKPKVIFWADNKFSELLNSTNLIGKLSMWIVQNCSQFIDAIVVPHEPALEDFEKYFTSTPVHLIEHPVISEKQCKKISELEQELLDEIKKRKKSGKTILMAIGRIEKEKGHLALLKSFANIQSIIEDINLVIVGDGSEKDRLLEEIERYNISKKVLITGWVKNISEFISLADIIVNPSLKEAFGNVIIESIYQNKNLIVSDCSSGAQTWLKKLFPDIKLVKPGNISDISKSLIELLNEKRNPSYDIDNISRFYVSEAGKKWKDLLEKYVTKQSERGV